MSQASFEQAFAADFFAAWSDLTGGISASYRSPSGDVGTAQVLVSMGSDQFGDGFAPVSTRDVQLVFLLEQVKPEQFAVVTVDGKSYRLVQRLAQGHDGIVSNDSVEVWGVEL